MNPSSLETLLSRLEGVIRVAGGHVARCPAHDDHEASLSVSEAHDGKILVCCHAGCPAEQIVAALGLGMRDLFPHGEQGGGGSVIPFRPRATVQPGDGCTLAAYAAEKRLPLEFLAGLGLTEINVNKMPAVRIPYRAPDGQEEAVQFRVELRKRDDGTDNRFRFKARTKPCPYGLERLAEIPSTGELVLVEGASDTQTLWYHDLPALGLPGAASWRESWAAYLEGPERIIVPIEPDKGGETLRKALAGSRVRDRIWLVYMPAETKDVSALHIQETRRPSRLAGRSLSRPPRPAPTSSSKRYRRPPLPLGRAVVSWPRRPASSTCCRATSRPAASPARHVSPSCSTSRSPVVSSNAPCRSRSRDPPVAASHSSPRRSSTLPA